MLELDGIDIGSCRTLVRDPAVSTDISCNPVVSRSVSTAAVERHCGPKYLDTWSKESPNR